MAQIVDMNFKTAATTTAHNNRMKDILNNPQVGANAIISGFKVTAQTPATMSLDIKKGSDPSNVLYVGGVRIEETTDIIGAWVGLTSPPLNNFRYDVLAYQYTYGATNAAATPTVVFGAVNGGVPAMPDATYIPLAILIMDATSAVVTSIDSSKILPYPKAVINHQPITTQYEWDALTCEGGSLNFTTLVKDNSAYRGVWRENRPPATVGSIIFDGEQVKSLTLRPFSYVAAIRMRVNANGNAGNVAIFKMLQRDLVNDIVLLGELDIKGTDFVATNTPQVFYLPFKLNTIANGIYPTVTLNDAACIIDIESVIVMPIHTEVYA